MMRHRVQCMIWVVTVLLSIPFSGESQSPRPKLEGMWSDPPSTAHPAGLPVRTPCDTIVP